MYRRREIASTSRRLRAARFILIHYRPTIMAINVRLLGSVTDAPQSLTYTRSGTPRFAFGVRVGSVRAKKYRITAYGSMARFCDIYLRTGQRIRVEGAYLRRVPLYDGLVRADTIRHVGSTILPYPGTLVRFVPARPPIAPVAASARPVPPPADDVALRIAPRDAAPVS